MTLVHLYSPSSVIYTLHSFLSVTAPFLHFKAEMVCSKAYLSQDMFFPAVFYQSIHLYSTKLLFP